MTTTHTQPACDLDSLEALARAATPGEWKNGYHDGVCGTRAAAGVSWDLTDVKSIPVSVGGEVVAWVAGFEPSNAEVEQMQRDVDFIAAANPATILSLIAAARAAQAPQGDTRQGAHTCTPADERAYHAMRKAHAFCPTELSHLDKMRWMAAYFIENYPRAAQGAGTAPAKSSIDAHTTSYHQGYMAGIEMGKAMAADEAAPVSTAAATTASASETPENVWNAAKEMAARRVEADCLGLKEDDAQLDKLAADIRAMPYREPVGNAEPVAITLLRELAGAAKVQLHGGVSSLGLAIDKAYALISMRAPSRAADGQQGASGECATCGGSQSASDPKGWQFARVPCPDCTPADGQQGASRASGMANQAAFKTACEKRGIEPSQELFSLWQDAQPRAPLPAQADGQAVDDALGEVDALASDALIPRRTLAEMRMRLKQIIVEVRAAQSRAQSDTTGDHDA